MQPTEMAQISAVIALQHISESASFKHLLSHSLLSSLSINSVLELAGIQAWFCSPHPAQLQSTNLFGVHVLL